MLKTLSLAQQKARAHIFEILNEYIRTKKYSKTRIAQRAEAEAYIKELENRSICVADLKSSESGDSEAFPNSTNSMNSTECSNPGVFLTELSTEGLIKPKMITSGGLSWKAATDQIIELGRQSQTKDRGPNNKGFREMAKDIAKAAGIDKAKRKQYFDRGRGKGKSEIRRQKNEHQKLEARLEKAEKQLREREQKIGAKEKKLKTSGKTKLKKRKEKPKVLVEQTEEVLVKGNTTESDGEINGTRGREVITSTKSKQEKAQKEDFVFVKQAKFIEPLIHRRRGRPKGSGNKPKDKNVYNHTSLKRQGRCLVELPGNTKEKEKEVWQADGMFNNMEDNGNLQVLPPVRKRRRIEDNI